MGPHLLRHTFATHVYAARRDPRLLQALLNDADLSQLHRYTAIADDRKVEGVQTLGQS